MELSPHPNDIRVRLVDMTVPWQTPNPIVKDAFLTMIFLLPEPSSRSKLSFS
jgi:hypothetical protein